MGSRGRCPNLLDGILAGQGCAPAAGVMGWCGRRRFRPAGATTVLPAQLALIALGFTGPEHSDLLAQLHIGLDERGDLVRNEDFMSTEEGVFVAGDMGRGQSLIVWAIAEGRAAAAAVGAYLTSRDLLPRPIRPDHAPIG